MLMWCLERERDKNYGTRKICCCVYKLFPRVNEVKFYECLHHYGKREKIKDGNKRKWLRKGKKGRKKKFLI